MSMTMVPASLLLVVGIVYGVEEGKEVKEMVGLLACPDREGGGWLACGEEKRCISKTQVNQLSCLLCRLDEGHLYGGEYSVVVLYPS